METRIMDKEELVRWVRELKPSFEVGILLVGDRLSAVDEAASVEIDGHIVSVATIAPQGEQLCGIPTIVAVFTLPEFRRKGYARETLVAAIARCRERGFPRVRIDVMSGYLMKIIDGLEPADRAYLDIVNHGPIMDFMSGMTG